MRHILEAAWRAGRQLRRHKTYATIAVLTVGLGIGFAMTIVAIVDAAAHPDLPVQAPRELMTVVYRGTNANPGETAVLDRGIADLTRGSHLARYRRAPTAATVRCGDEVVNANVASVSPGFFDLIQPRLIAGRVFGSRDSREVPGAVVSAALVRAVCGRASLGQISITIHDTAYPIIGIVDAGFEFPRLHDPYDRSTFSQTTDVWIPAAGSDFQYADPMLVRISDGWSLQRFRLRVASLMAAIPGLSGAPHGGRFLIEPAFPSRVQGDGADWAMLGGAMAVLLISVLNLLHLQLTRDSKERQRWAVRTALGATRGQVFQEVLYANAWLVLGGALLGGLVAFLGIHMIAAWIPASMRLEIAPPRLTRRVLVCGAAATAGWFAVGGLWPALRLSLRTPQLASARPSPTGKRRRIGHSGLVLATQVAASLALACTAFALFGSAFALEHHQFGVAIDQLVQAWVPVDQLASGETLDDRTATVLARARQIPGVREAAAFRAAPFTGHVISVSRGNGSPTELRVPAETMPLVVTPTFLWTLGARVIGGRDLDFDAPQQSGAVIDSVTARAWWPNERAVGQSIKLGPVSGSTGWIPVVGVSTHMWWGAEDLYAPPAVPEIMIVQRAEPTHIWLVNMFLRVSGNPEEVARRFTSTFGATKPAKGIRVSAVPLAVQLGVAQMRAQQSFVAKIFATFGLLGLAMASFGVYAIASYSVERRRRDIAIRMALGATPRGIIWGVIGSGVRATLSGIALGFLLGDWIHALLNAYAVGAPRGDLNAYLVAGIAVLAVALASSYIPARGATIVNPAELLRGE